MVRRSPQKEILARFKGQSLVDEIALERSLDISFFFASSLWFSVSLSLFQRKVSVESRNEYETRVRAIQMEPSVHFPLASFSAFPVRINNLALGEICSVLAP
ncbi:hypothetical protein BJX65DRAFT_253469 [Aspergillus insuetus]